MKKNTPINTEKLASNERTDMWDWIRGGNPNAIRAQEAQGQNLFVKSETLPTRMNSYRINIKAILESAGVKFLGAVEDDPLFQYVELPLGWKKVPTDHSMWSNLVDDKGRVRAMIFYKAAFYDRDAHLSISQRYDVRFDYDRFNNEHVAVAHVMDSEKVLYTTDPIDGTGIKSYEASDMAMPLATAWLEEHFPEYKNPAKYWD
jgi:hypothetical protein